MTELKKMRLANNLTQQDMATSANITLRSYQYYETGEKKPSVDIAILIAKKLNCKVEDIF